MDKRSSSAAKKSGDPFIISGWRVDPASLRICNEKHTIKLQPKAMAVLDYLACRHGTVVGRQELEDEVWARTTVGYDALSNAIIKLRKALGDKARQPRIIETIAKTGYRLIAEMSFTGPAEPGIVVVTALSTPVGTAIKPVLLRWPFASALVLVIVFLTVGTFWWQPWVLKEEPASLQRMALALPDKPSIAVLPFDNLGGDPEQEIFTDGLTMDIITDLSKFRHLFVIASNSTFSYKGKAVKVQQVAEELGVRYVLEGSFQRAGERLRINAQLIDATTGRHLWAERYDRDASDFFAIQEEILRTIVASLASQITESEIERALEKRPSDLGAYDYYQRAWKLFFTFSKEGNNQALKLLEKAIELDPKYARAYGLLSWVEANNSSRRYSWGEDPERSLDLTLEFARKAVQLAADDYLSHWALGYASMVRGDFDRAYAEYERALALNPSDATLLVNMAELLYKTGRAEQAIAQINLAMRINPLHPDWYYWDLGLAQYIAKQYQEALDTLNRMSNPSNGVRRTRAAVLVRLGRIEEARGVITKFIGIDLDMTLEDMEASAWEDRESIGRWIKDLRKAGLPEKRPLP